MGPEHHVFEKETHLPNHHFCVPNVNFQGCISPESRVDISSVSCAWSTCTATPVPPILPKVAAVSSTVPIKMISVSWFSCGVSKDAFSSCCWHWGGRVGGATEESGRGFVFTKGILHRYRDRMLFDTTYAHIHSTYTSHGRTPNGFFTWDWYFVLICFLSYSDSYISYEIPTLQDSKSSTSGFRVLPWRRAAGDIDDGTCLVFWEGLVKVCIWSF